MLPPAAAPPVPLIRITRLEMRLGLTGGPSAPIPRVEQLEQIFGLAAAGSLFERLAALEAAFAEANL